MCKAQRTAIGAEAFKAMYNPTGSNASAFGKCVSKAAQADKQNRVKAAEQCRTEREDANFAATHSGQSFAQVYGSNDNDRNAFGKCVSAKAHAAAAEQQQTTVKAAKACKAERALNRQAFATKYSGNGNSSAFGRCVSQKSKNG